jgi:hypothetical protein
MKTFPRNAALLVVIGLLAASGGAADHNDPNAVNSIFSDVALDGADLYDFFGFPSDDGERVAVALTFAPSPEPGVLDPDLLYRVLIAPTPRIVSSADDDHGFASLARHVEAVRERYVALQPAEVRVRAKTRGEALVELAGFPGGSFSQVVPTNRVATLRAPGGAAIQVYVGARDDAFFNDLPGFFRSINYAPQFYRVPRAMHAARELEIPKTLLELEGNALFNFDPEKPDHGQGMKLDLPSGALAWDGDAFYKDADGNFRFVYSGRDAQAGLDVNAIVLELPLSFVTVQPERDRVVNAWGESWVLKASSRIEAIPDEREALSLPLVLRRPWVLPVASIVLGVIAAVLGVRALRSRERRRLGPALGTAVGIALLLLGVVAGRIIVPIARQVPELAKAPSELDEDLRSYKLVDTDGQPFADAALNQREDLRQLGAFNLTLGLSFVPRLAHLGWGFGPSIDALGLRTAFDHDSSPISIHRTYSSAVAAFPRVRKVVFQTLNMPDDTWKKRGVDVPLKRAVDIFVPNVCPIDMDTTGTWPFGRRLEDQVATRFLALFLDMESEVDGRPAHLETLSDQALWDRAPIQPKTPPNPLANDKEFLDEFPYLAAPWASTYQ